MTVSDVSPGCRCVCGRCWAGPRPPQAQVEPCPAPGQSAARRTRRCSSAASQLVAHPINETIIDRRHLQLLHQDAADRTRARTSVVARTTRTRVKADFWNLWRTSFLDNLWIEVIDEPFENGVAAKHVIFHIEERSARQGRGLRRQGKAPRRTVDISKIEDTLRDKNVHVSLDSFVDEATIRQVKGVIREIYADKGYNDVRIETDDQADCRPARSSST